MTTPPTPAADPAKVREDVIARHQAMVWRYLRFLGCSPARADDLTQDTFLVFLKQTFVEQNPRATAAYLRRIAYHRFVSDCRKQDRLIVTDQIEALDRLWVRWAGDTSGEGLLEDLRDCLATLSERARKALELRFADDASRSQIAAALNITEHGARNLMQRAKQKLRHCMEQKQTGHAREPTKG